MKFQRAYYAGEASGEALNATGLTVMVKDAYGSTVKTFSGALTIVEAVGANGSSCEPDLSGDTKADFYAGLATFEDLAIYCAPGAEVRLRASLSTDCCGDFEAETVVALRNCVPGEYLYEDSAGKVSCQACPAGSVSYEPTTSCARCPDNAACAGGHGLVPDRGYWRGAGDSLNVLKCASDDFCAADVDLWDYAALETARSPSPQCAHRHAGPRCALCERSTYLEEASLKCRACASDASIDDTSYALAGVALGIVFLALVLYGLWRRYGHLVVDSEMFVTLNEKWLPLLVPKLKIAVVTFQIVGSFSEAFASVTYPRLFGEFARSLDVLGLGGQGRRRGGRPGGQGRRRGAGGPPSSPKPPAQPSAQPPRRRRRRRRAPSPPPQPPPQPSAQPSAQPPPRPRGGRGRRGRRGRRGGRGGRRAGEGPVRRGPRLDARLRAR